MVVECMCVALCVLLSAGHREWVSCVLGVFLTLPWSSRKTAASSLSSLVQHKSEWSSDLIGGLENALTKSEFNERAVLEALQCLATPTHPQREAIALSVLLMTHHPLLGQLSFNWDRHPWTLATCPEL